MFTVAARQSRSFLRDGDSEKRYTTGKHITTALQRKQEMPEIVDVLGSAAWSAVCNGISGKLRGIVAIKYAISAERHE